MPYISSFERELHAKGKLAPLTEGQLNYMITMLCQEYLDLNIINYRNINAVVGALECVKQEFYRRLAAPYEDTKIEQNGDVY